jgi:hypothetical protein
MVLTGLSFHKLCVFNTKSYKQNTQARSNDRNAEWYCDIMRNTAAGCKTEILPTQGVLIKMWVPTFVLARQAEAQMVSEQPYLEA